jgi:hypothetical protein
VLYLTVFAKLIKSTSRFKFSNSILAKVLDKSNRRGFMKMRKLSLLIALFLAVGGVAAQSLKPDDPYPLKEGINEGISDSFVGMQYWYYYITPGNNRLTVRFKNPNTIFGAPLNTTLTITLYDEKKTWQVTKVVNSNKNTSEATFEADKVKTKIKVIVRVSPPNGTLVRMGGDYEIEATGDQQFDEVKNTVDPIVRTYDGGQYGVTKFLAGGTIETSTGATGTWKVFDSESRIYKVVLDGDQFAVQYFPAHGLKERGNLKFTEVRR